MTEQSAKRNKVPKGVKITLRILFSICFYVVLIWGMMQFTKSAYEFSYQIFGNVSVEKEPGADVLITIRRGDTTKYIAELLEYKSVIKNQYSFFIRAKLMVNASDPILPGVYKLNTSMNYGEIIETITDPSANLENNIELE